MKASFITSQFLRPSENFPATKSSDGYNLNKIKRHTFPLWTTLMNICGQMTQNLA